MKLISQAPAPGGYLLKVEVPDAFTDGSSRFDDVFVPSEDADGRTPEEVMDAVNTAATSSPFDTLIGKTIRVPTQTRAVYEARLEKQRRVLAMWRAFEEEAVAQGEPDPGALLTALRARRAAVWADIKATLVKWRTAS